MRKPAGLALAVIALVASSALTSSASAVPDKKCQGNAENFQVVNGRCVSDGRAEKLR
jgi:uncharacterized protein YfaQ (DUF2300 family)